MGDDTSASNHNLTTEFARKLRAMLAIYFETERQFLEFDSIVPYHLNPEAAYSPRLYSIHQSAGSQVASLLRLITKQAGLASKAYRFPAHYDALNERGLLAFLKVTTQRRIAPFRPFENRNPDWWQAYNDTKHDLPAGIFSVNLGTVLHTLGAVAVLHYLGCMVAMRDEPKSEVNDLKDYPHALLDSGNWVDFEQAFRADPNADDAIKVEKDGYTAIWPSKPAWMASLRSVDVLDLERDSGLFYYLCFFFPWPKELAALRQRRKDWRTGSP